MDESDARVTRSGMRARVPAGHTAGSSSRAAGDRVGDRRGRRDRRCLDAPLALVTTIGSRYDLPLIEGGAMRTLIANGTVVTADGSYAADVLIDGETIAADRRGLGRERDDRRRDHRRAPAGT